MATFKELSAADIKTSRSFLNQLVDIIQEDIDEKIIVDRIANEILCNLQNKKTNRFKSIYLINRSSIKRFARTFSDSMQYVKRLSHFGVMMVASLLLLMSNATHAILPDKQNDDGGFLVDLRHDVYSLSQKLKKLKQRSKENIDSEL